MYTAGDMKYIVVVFKAQRYHADIREKQNTLYEIYRGRLHKQGDRNRTWRSLGKILLEDEEIHKSRKYQLDTGPN